MTVRLHDSETLLRRFDPERIDHVIMDEGTGRIRLRTGAVLLRRDENGISLYRERLLRCQGLPNESICEAGYVGVAAATVSAIRVDAAPLDAFSDPWPDAREPMPSREVAHALVSPPPGLSGNRTRKALECLARCFGDVGSG